MKYRMSSMFNVYAFVESLKYKHKQEIKTQNKKTPNTSQTTTETVMSVFQQVKI